MNYHNLSLSDLLEVEGFAEAYGANDKKKMKEILWNCGMDTTQEVEEMFCEHRNLQNQVVKCLRYSGYERTDKEWIKSGYATLEAIIASSKDPYLRKELRTMSREMAIDRSFDGAIQENV